MFLNRITQHSQVAGNTPPVTRGTYFDALRQFSVISLHFLVLGEQRILVVALVPGSVIHGRQLITLTSGSLLGRLG